ncbi:hypothetical protein NRS6186_22080 (plasmid) [Bacillus subtilis]|uniref:hypothetical protein n=1 Tax=Bacillus subtilis TaxID=1423 RepID=UPI001B90C6E9|nr:hypothetical protein [Bacillus subtilis]CAF1900057.1 hypothetical protein NRS6186_04055 [Bacillus subtilis]CAI6330302.1 hypothetical protein NRS6186_22080 [Bacillus subtilis]
MEIKRITRKEFESFPKFKNVEEAIKFFKEKYGDHFMEQGLGPFEEFELGKYYHHLLVLDKEGLKRMSEWMIKNNRLTFPEDSYSETKGMNESVQAIFIFENGRVQVSNLARNKKSKSRHKLSAFNHSKCLSRSSENFIIIAYLFAILAIFIYVHVYDCISIFFIVG